MAIGFWTINALKVGKASRDGLLRVAEQRGLTKAGEAIAGLHGAPATSAAVAWIGRRIGGRGMKAGGRLLGFVQYTPPVLVGGLEAAARLAKRRYEASPVQGGTGAGLAKPEDGEPSAP
jgi:hypothetical protein